MQTVESHIQEIKSFINEDDGKAYLSGDFIFNFNFKYAHTNYLYLARKGDNDDEFYSASDCDNSRLVINQLVIHSNEVL